MGFEDDEEENKGSNADYQYPFISPYQTDNQRFVDNLIHYYKARPNDDKLKRWLMTVEGYLVNHALTTCYDYKIVNILAGYNFDDNLDFHPMQSKVNDNIYCAYVPSEYEEDTKIYRILRTFDISLYGTKYDHLTETGYSHLIEIMGGTYGGRTGEHAKRVLDFLFFFKDEMLVQRAYATVIPATITESMYIKDRTGKRCCVPDALAVLYDQAPSIAKILLNDGLYFSPTRPRSFPAFGDSAFLQIEIQLNDLGALVGKLQKNISLNSEDETLYHIYPVFVIWESPQTKSGFPAFEKVLGDLTAILRPEDRPNRLKLFNLVSFNEFEGSVMTLDWPKRTGQFVRPPKYKVYRYEENHE